MTQVYTQLQGLSINSITDTNGVILYIDTEFPFHGKQILFQNILINLTNTGMSWIHTHNLEMQCTTPCAIAMPCHGILDMTAYTHTNTHREGIFYIMKFTLASSIHFQFNC